MDKRLARTDLMFALGFLFMLVVAVAAFFYGVRVGASHADKEQSKTAQAPAVQPVSMNAYQLQDLVSFYHTVFLPYREMLADWQSARQKWQADESADRAASLKELAKEANADYEAVKVANVPAASPLLKEAQNQYLKSLKLYADGFAQFAAEANAGTAAAALKQIDESAYYKDAVKFGLDAQRQYYEAMVKWAATVDIDIPTEVALKPSVDLSSWSGQPLVVKNAVVAQYLQGRSLMTGFLPQDLTARIDSFVASGQASKMKLKTMSAVADLLTQTDAVREGDFLNAKVRLYDKQLLPQLPFFSVDK